MRINFGPLHPASSVLTYTNQVDAHTGERTNRELSECRDSLICMHVMAGAEADGKATGAWVELQHAVPYQGQPGHYAGGSRPAGGRFQRVL